MQSRPHRVIFVSLLMIFSSLAGCLGSEDEADLEGKYGTVLVSTYHISEIVNAIAGDTVNVELISDDNLPVHDFEPSLKDIAKIGKADLFLYHGLNLEPWAESTLEGLGSDAPEHYGMTHVMPTGESPLDYESLLISELCEHLSEGPYEKTTLIGDEEHADDAEIHAEHVAHTLSFPIDSHDDDHDEHDHDEHDHDDDHSDEERDRDDHDDRHNHLLPKEIISKLTGCPADTVVYVFELEEGEYVLEFDTEHHDEFAQFNMVALKKGGAHHHHDHGDEDEHDHANETHEDDDEHDHGNETHEDGDDAPTPEELLSEYDSDDDSKLSWDEFVEAMNEDHDHDEHDHDEHDHANETHEDDDDHDDQKVFHEIFNESDMDNDGLLNLTELDHFIEGIEALETASYVTIHIEAEGEYGFALPREVAMFILSNEDGHDHDDHSDEERDGHDHDDVDLTYDPHSWLDPIAYKAQVKVVLDYLIDAFPEGKDVFTNNTEAFMVELDELDSKFTTALNSASCGDRTVLANHNAYSYLANRYDLEFVTVHGLDPEGEPTPEDIAKVVSKINDKEIKVLFVEEYTSKKAVQSIVDETGVEIKILYTMEMAPIDSNDNYLSLMNKNLDNILSGIGC